MTEGQFNSVIEKVLDYLVLDCQRQPERYRKSGEDFEPLVKTAVGFAIEVLALEVSVDYTPGGHGFPDIVLEGKDGSKYGIEVKSSSGPGNTWRINGNSVLGSTRVSGILKTVLVFGKLRGGNSVFRAREYEKCIANVVVTHSPRYLIDMELKEGESFFEKSKISYAEICQSAQPIQLITDYFQSIGQKAWWLAESSPAVIRMFGDLPRVEQRMLMGYAFAHFPEVFSSSSTKFYRYMSWLVSEKSVIDPALRDRFTAGGRACVELSTASYERLPRIFKKLHEHRDYVLMELEKADLRLLEEDWGRVPSPEFDERIQQWFRLVEAVVVDSPLEQVSTHQLLKEILLA